MSCPIATQADRDGEWGRYEAVTSCLILGTLVVRLKDLQTRRPTWGEWMGGFRGQSGISEGGERGEKKMRGKGRHSTRSSQGRGPLSNSSRNGVGWKRPLLLSRFVSDQIEIE